MRRSCKKWPEALETKLPSQNISEKDGEIKQQLLRWLPRRRNQDVDLHTRCTDRFEIGRKEVSDIKEIARKKITLGQINNANGDYMSSITMERGSIYSNMNQVKWTLLGNYRWSDVLNNDTVEKKIVENKKA